MADLQIAREPWPAQIVIAISQLEIFVAQFSVELKWEILGSVQNRERVRDNLDLPRRQFGIFRARQAGRHFAGDLNHIFGTQAVRLFRHVGIFFRTEHNLGQAFAVAQIDENDPAMIATDGDPAGEFHFAIDIGFAQLIAIMGPVHGCRVILSDGTNHASASIIGSFL